MANWRRVREDAKGEREPLVVIRAAQVVATVRADQLAAMALQPVPAGGAYLAMVINSLGISTGIAGAGIAGWRIALKNGAGSRFTM